MRNITARRMTTRAAILACQGSQWTQDEVIDDSSPRGGAVTRDTLSPVQGFY